MPRRYSMHYTLHPGTVLTAHHAPQAAQTKWKKILDEGSGTIFY
jgi:hypothetical protein